VPAVAALCIDKNKIFNRRNTIRKYDDVFIISILIIYAEFVYSSIKDGCLSGYPSSIDAFLDAFKVFQRTKGKAEQEDQKICIYYF
jgi:hypothetical protein